MIVSILCFVLVAFKSITKRTDPKLLKIYNYAVDKHSVAIKERLGNVYTPDLYWKCHKYKYSKTAHIKYKAKNNFNLTISNSMSEDVNCQNRYIIKILNYVLGIVLLGKHYLIDISAYIQFKWRLTFVVECTDLKFIWRSISVI